MAVNQASLNAGIAKLNASLSSANVTDVVRSYWTGLFSKGYRLHSNGTVQSTCSNPVAYFLVPLSGDGTKGRSHAFVMQQFEYALQHGLTKNAHIALRGIDESAIKAGMSFNRARKDSMLGSVEGRQAASIVSGTVMSDSSKGKAAKEVIKLDAAKIEGNRSSYSNSMDAIAALLAASEKRNAKATPAPAVTKPVQQENTPVVTKTGRKARGAQA